jgi:hypothetical protein
LTNNSKHIAISSNSKWLYHLTIVGLFCSILLNTTIYCQEPSNKRKEEKKEKNQMIDSLNARIQRIKYAEFTKMPSYQDLLLKGSNYPYAELLLGIRDYFVDRLHIEVISSLDELKKRQEEVTSDQIVTVYAETGVFNQKAGAIGNYSFYFSLKFSDGKEFSFKTKAVVMGITDYRLLTYNVIEFNFPVSKFVKD